MNKKILLILALFAINIAFAGTYHDDDKTALRNFLIQDNNGTILGLSNSDMTILNGNDWLTDESWVSKVEDIYWNTNNPKRITLIYWSWYNHKSGSLTGNLDLSNCTALISLSCPYNQLTNLNTSGCIVLTTLYCGDNQFANLNISNCTALTSLSCSFNQLTSLNVSGCVVLENLSCSYNQLTTLDISKNTALTSLICMDNQLTSLDVSNNPELGWLGCDGNRLTSLDVSKNSALIGFRCRGNQLTSLDVSNCIELSSLWCGGNQLVSLDVSKNIGLEELNCSGNYLTSLDIFNNTKLVFLVCSGNQLTNLDVSKNTKLYTLICGNNKTDMAQYLYGHIYEYEYRWIDEIGLYYYVVPYLQSGGNYLTNLNLSNNTALVYLDCSNNRITNLNMPQNDSLYLVLSNNQLKFSTLPLGNYRGDFLDFFLFENNLEDDIDKNIIDSLYRDFSCYAPQNTIYGGNIAYTEPVDLSSEYDIAGNITNYTWFDITDGNETPVMLSGNNGVFMLDGSYIGKTLRCKMTNATFPDFDKAPLIYEVDVKENVGISDNNEQYLSIYPNPADNKLTIDNGNIIMNKISLFDIDGKLITTYNNIGATSYVIDISKLAVGTYTLNVDGNTLRFVVKR